MAEEVVEKRIQRRVIRRRVQTTAESVQPAQQAKQEGLSPDLSLLSETAAAADQNQTSLAVSDSQMVSSPPLAEATGDGPASKPAPATEQAPSEAKPVGFAPSPQAPKTQLAGLGVVAGLKKGEMGIEGRRPIILGTIDLGKHKAATAVTATPVASEAEELKARQLKKVVKKKEWDNRDIDVGIDGVGRLGNLGQLTRLSPYTPASTTTTAPERVFRPSASLKKKRVVGKKGLRKTEMTTPSAAKRVIKMGKAISVAELSKAMGVKAALVFDKLSSVGIEEAVLNTPLDADTVGVIAHDFHYEVKQELFDEAKVLRGSGKESAVSANRVPRPPVVAVMGHVDHGKTSLLDAIRKTHVASGEAGGITQHIGAYTVMLPQGRITFLDTPGHEAFTAMRARGAAVTDIAILVVAADEGVKPQTIESIRHGKAAGVPIVVAITKSDKPEANFDRVKRELSEQGLMSEDWGGDVVMVPVSAHTKAGIPQLLEMILLQAELLELKADPTERAQGVVIEAQLDRGRGPVATVIVKQGTLRVGDWLVAGTVYGKLRAMTDPDGRAIKEAKPSEAVQILGLSAVPLAGDPVIVAVDDKAAKQVVAHREAERHTAQQEAAPKVSLETLFQESQQDKAHALRVLLKADVQGSLEAVKEALTQLSTDEVKVEVLHAGVGAITESDIMLASASRAIAIGFHVRPETKGIALAERERVEVKLYRIIYELIDDVKRAMKGMLAPTTREVYLGRAEVRATFTISKVGLIAGCHVVDGKITRSAKVRLLRENVVIADVQIASLKRVKDDAREVTKGLECGIGLEGKPEIRAGDVLEAYLIETVASE